MVMEKINFFSFYITLPIFLAINASVSLTNNYIYRANAVSNGLFYLHMSGALLMAPGAVPRIETTVINCAMSCLSTQNCSFFSFSGIFKPPMINCVLVKIPFFEDASLHDNASWDYYKTTPNTMCAKDTACNRFKSYQGGRLGYGGCHCIPLKVVSTGKPALQSSTYASANASRAVDGNKLTYFWQNATCAHTDENNEFPWWTVDLGDTYYIASIAITNRVDCCPERLDNAILRVGMSSQNYGLANPLCTANHVKIAAGETKEFRCDNEHMFGKYVTISLPFQHPLTLCEVEVFGIKL